ncbi:NACHT domain-containing protein [Nostoc sp. NIES-2111]
MIHMSADLEKGLVGNLIYDEIKETAFVKRWGKLIGIGIAVVIAILMAAVVKWREDRLANEDPTSEPALLLRKGLAARVLDYAQKQFESGLYGIASYEFQLTKRPLGLIAQDTKLDVLIDAYYRKIEGPLVVLGEPGTGKTTLLYELATSLSPVAGSEDPIAVPFHLARWRPTESTLEEWLALELRRDYGVRLEVGKSWLRREVVIPLLDGLDEVPAAVRRNCLDQIHEYAERHPRVQFVLSCREREFEELGQEIARAKFVATRAMDRKALEQYLDQYRDKFTGLRAALVEDAQLWDLLDSPLMLWVAALAFRKYDANSGLQGTTTKNKLFELYLDQMLKRDRNRAQEEEEPALYPEEAKRWLKELALAMQRAKVYSFQLEDLELAWGKERSRDTSFFLLAGLLGLLGGLLGLVPAILDETVPLWIPLAFDMGGGSGQDDWRQVLGTVDWKLYLLWCPLAGVATGLVIGLVMIVLAKLVPNETLNAVQEEEDDLLSISRTKSIAILCIVVLAGWSASRFAGWIHTTFIAPFTAEIGISFGAMGWGATMGGFAWLFSLISRPEDERRWSWKAAIPAGCAGMALGAGYALHLSWIYTLASALIWSLVFAMANGPQIVPLANRNAVSSGFRLSLRLALTSLAGCAVLILVIALAANSPVMAYNLILIGALGCILVLVRGGAFCLRHIGVRAILAGQKVIPWRMERFLEFAVDHVFLIRQGGSFRFVHRLLQEHLAETGKP